MKSLSPWRSSHRAWVCLDCQTMALYMGLPSRSKTTAVSRWLVIPMPATSSMLAIETTSSSLITSMTEMNILSALCSTYPGLGKRHSTSRCALYSGLPCRSRSKARVEVVP